MGFFPFWRFAQGGPAVEQPGAGSSPLPGRGRRPNWGKGLKIPVLPHALLFNFRIQDGREAVKENSLGSPV